MQPRIIKELSIWANGEYTGSLKRHYQPEQKTFYYSFQYDEHAKHENPISILMPVRPEPYYSRELHPVFESGLPEGYLRQVIIRQFGRDILPDEMGVLMITGQNRIGHLQCVEPGFTPKNFNRTINDDTFNGQQWKNQDDVAQCVEKLVGEFCEQSGIPGAMPKFLAEKIDRATLNIENKILKFDAQDLPFLAANEYFCLLAARKSGLTVANAELLLDGKGLAIDRFDIVNGRRIGFEDMCSLFGMPSASKYQATTEMLLDRVKLLSIEEGAAERSAKELFKAMVFSQVIRNGDAHLKNFGILFDGYNIQFAPIFDLVTTSAYPAFGSDKLALSVNGSLKWSTRSEIMDASVLYGIEYSDALKILSDIEVAINETATELFEFATHHTHIDAKSIMLSMLVEWEKGLSGLMLQSDLSEKIKQLHSQVHNNTEPKVIIA